MLNADILWAAYLQTETVVETNKYTNKVRILVLLKVNTVIYSCTSVAGEDVSGEAGNRCITTVLTTTPWGTYVLYVSDIRTVGI